MRSRIYFILAALSLLSACKSDKAAPPEENVEPSKIADISFVMTRTLPHDINSFTEGLLFHEGKLYESTGATPELPTTRSAFGEVNLSTGKINIKAELDRDKYFGEGITFLNGKVYQLTWTSKVGFIYDAKTFKKLGQFSIPREEGWGMTTDGTSLIMSDGTDKLTYIDPVTLAVTKSLAVSEDGYTLRNLNELEYVDGYIYANIWMTSHIVKIDVATGEVVGNLDLTPLAEEAAHTSRGTKEMNGIAYNPETKKFFITGKMWPYIFEIELR